MNNIIFLNNVEVRREELGMKIGDFEKAVDVSAGYFSRLQKNPESLPSMDLILKVSSVLQISTDILLKVDLRGLSKSEMLTYNFVSRLREDTINEKLVWVRQESILDFQSIEVGESEKKYGSKAYTNGSMFKAEFGTGRHISIKPLLLRVKKVDYPFCEIWITGDEDGSMVEVCSSCNVPPITQVVVNELFQSILIQGMKPQLESDVKDLMQEYLNS